VGLARFLALGGVTVVEVDRPNRQARRKVGKSDPLDAVAAARAALSGAASGEAKGRDGDVEAIRVLRVARQGAAKDRVRAINQLRAVVATAPDALREPLRGLTRRRLVTTCAALRPGAELDVVSATKHALRELARRVQHLDEELGRLDGLLEPLVTKVAPELMALHAVGPETAGALLVTAGDNAGRLRHEAAFARLCGSAPIPASSGRVVRHRLHRGGDRSANAALWRIVLIRMGTDERTKAYVARRTAEGLSKPEIMRCLKRYVAREIFRHLPATLERRRRQLPGEPLVAGADLVGQLVPGAEEGADVVLGSEVAVTLS
jgi:transposase